MDGRGFVAVHVGAGYHSPANGAFYKQVCHTACLQAIEVLKQKRSSLDAVTAATMALEDSPWTNAGTGSNLTITGQVECDASIMDGDSLHYGAVGAVSGVKNPIRVAESLLKTQMQGAMSLGRIPPSTLAGAGAKEWAKKNHIPTCKQDALLTDASKRAFIKHKRKLDMLEEGLAMSSKKSIKLEHSNSRGDATSDGQADKIQQPKETGNKVSSKKEPHFSAAKNTQVTENKAEMCSTDGQTDGRSPMCCRQKDQSSISSPNEEEPQPCPHTHNNSTTPTSPTITTASSSSSSSSSDTTQSCKSSDCLLDTVGAICVDSLGHVASAVSSGGIVLKQSGRLGQAALYGCGCWAEYDPKTQAGVGISTSGCGEHLSKTLIACECARHVSQYDDPVIGIADAFKNKFLDSHFLNNLEQKLGGALAIKSHYTEDQLDVEVIWVHTTDSMCLAYMSTADEEPKALISRLPEGKQCGRSFVVQSKCETIAKEFRYQLPMFLQAVDAGVKPPALHVDTAFTHLS